MENGKKKTVHGIIINTKPELDLSHVPKDDPIFQKRDPLAEAFERGEFSIPIESIEAGNKVFNEMYDALFPNDFKKQGV